MSHVFISYKREDERHRDIVINYLRTRHIPFWVDLDIEAGVGWREEIDGALSNAFALVVVITNNTPKSHYVTYEWAWALGNGLPVLPLVFEETQVENLHRKLSSLQFVNCRPEIPTDLEDTLLQHQKQSQLARYTNTKIAEAISPTMSLVALTVIFSEYYDAGIVTTTDLNSMIYALAEALFTLNKTHLPSLWVSTAHSFTPLQRKTFRDFGAEIENLTQIVRGVIPNIRFDEYRKDFGDFAADFFKSYPSCLPEIRNIWNDRLKHLWYFFTNNSHWLYPFVAPALEETQRTNLLVHRLGHTEQHISKVFIYILEDSIEQREYKLFERLKVAITGVGIAMG